jgi:hypothetical protein
VLTRRGKHDEGERKERGGTTVKGCHPFTGGHSRVGAGGSSGEWRHTAGGREGGPGGAWRERGGVWRPRRVSGGAGSRPGGAVA